MFLVQSSLALSILGDDIVGLKPTSSGLNIVGGKARIHGSDVLVKFVGRDAALAQCAADSLKPLFGFERIGCRTAKLASPFTHKGRTLKEGTSMLLLSWIDGLEDAKDCSRRLHHQASGIEFCANDGQIFVSWLRAICLRLLVCGARDPWSNTAWDASKQTFVSFDEGSAFSASMAPDDWSYFNGKIKLKADYRKRLFLDGGSIVAELAYRWMFIDREAIRSTLSEFYPADRCDELVLYIDGNIRALNKTFALLCKASCEPQLIAHQFVHPPYEERAYNRQTFLGGYNVAEAKSWLQKSARRGLDDQCRFSAMLMLASQNITNLVHRLLTMCVEDCLHPSLVIEICKRWKILKSIQESVPWRDMRDLVQVRQLIAEMADYISLAPSSRIADHVGALYFKEDHPYVGGTPAFDCPILGSSRDEAYGTFVHLIDKCASDEWTLELEQKMLFIAGGMWSHRNDIEREKPLELLRLLSTRPKPNSPAMLSMVLNSLVCMMEEIHKPNPMRGKLNLIAGIIMYARSPPSIVDADHSLDWTSFPEIVHPLIDSEYTDLISGSLRCQVPEWVHDLHCGKHEEKSAFLQREQVALHQIRLADDYYAPALQACVTRESRSQKGTKKRTKR